MKARNRCPRERSIASLRAPHVKSEGLDEAIAQYRKALEINSDQAEAHYNLGLILARLGKSDEALVHYQKALGLASANNDTALANVIRARIKMSR